MRAQAATLAATGLLAMSIAEPFSFVSGGIRVQVLSPTLVRIEQRGPKGFEDRATFHIVERDWPGANVVVRKGEGKTTLDAGAIKIVVKEPANGVGDVEVLRGRTPIYQSDGKLTNSVWLPAPGETPQAWAFADTPRLVAGPQGLAPGGDDPTSGWDLSNDAPDLYVFLPNQDYATLRRDFLRLTGPVEMPPLYALGFTDSRYYEYKQEEALARMDEYRRRGFPLDTFVVDTDWRNGGSHGYDVNLADFPDMKAFFQAAHDRHVHIMFNDHPEPLHDTALDPKELAYRYQNLGGLLKEGLDVWWYDRNWGVSLHDPAPGLRHEVWGMKMYRDMTLAAKPNRRPLIMANVDGIDNGIRSRPPDVAAHRYPVQWTGDTTARWSYLRKGVENAVFEGVQGLNPWVNEDLGGHMGNPTDELYIRYLQFGALCPFMRVHCTKGQTREPWAYGHDAEGIVREYIRMRYRLQPYLYALARRAYDDGTPLLRRLDLVYPNQKEATRNDQYLLGDFILVAPIVGGEDGPTVPESAFPGGLQAEFFNGRNLQGEPFLRRVDPTLAFDWGDGGIQPGAPADDFSARWTGKITIPAGKPRRVSITGDDGVRVWIDGKLVVDRWIGQDSVTTEAPVDLAPGSTHDLKVEYMEQQYNARVRLSWRESDPTEQDRREVWIPPGTWTDVWSGQAFRGPRLISAQATLEQTPIFVRQGAIIPLGPDVMWTGERDWSDLSLDLWPGTADTELYEDDGSSRGYQSGAFRRTPLRMRVANDKIEVSVGAAVGPVAEPTERSWTLRLHLPMGQSIQSAMIGEVPLYVRTIPADARGLPFSPGRGSADGTTFEVTVPSRATSTAFTVRMGVAR